MSDPVNLPSDGRIASIDGHFRVSAGPGAGKTHWLAEHVRRVVRESERLVPGAKVLCVSYTNVAVAELAARMGPCGDRVETSTLHAFLYKHVLQPYAHLLRNDDGTPMLDHAALDGHDEHRPTYGRIKTWLERAGVHQAVRNFLLNQELTETVKVLKRTRWEEQADGTWKLCLPQSARPSRFPSTKLDTYKPVYWAEGIVDHDDVLHLSREIVGRFPLLCRFLADRFPYVFVDEFQDTHPAQTQLLKRLAEAGSTVGIIGDVHQSIYGFQNARPEDFSGLTLPNIADYRIEQNRRSTQPIVKLLNAARKDGLRQTSLRGSGESASAVQALVGSPEETLAAVRAGFGSSDAFVSLAFRNDSVAGLRRAASGYAGDPWAALEAADSKRAEFLHRLLQGAALADDGQLGLAVRKAFECLRLRRSRPSEPVSDAVVLDKVSGQGVALTLLEAIRKIDGQTTALEAYAELRSVLVSAHGIDLKKVVGGKFKQAASKIRIEELRAGLHTPDARAQFSTIHGAKGAEFDSVAVFFPDAKTLDRCLDGATEDTEDLRVHYVAMSRARDRLFLCFPEDPSPGLAGRLRELGVSLDQPYPSQCPAHPELQPSLC